MPKASISSGTKNAQVKQRGQTASNRYGSDPSFKGKASTPKRDLTAK